MSPFSRTHIYTSICACIYLYVYCIHVSCSRTYMHFTRIYSYTHTHIHTYTYITGMVLLAVNLYIFVFFICGSLAMWACLDVYPRNTEMKERGVTAFWQVFAVLRSHKELCLRVCGRLRAYRIYNVQSCF